MHRTLALMLTASLALSCAYAADPSPTVQGNTAFACDLYGKLKYKPGNLFYSPYSISAALGMASAGARGETLDEMAKMLHLPASEAAHAGFAELTRKLQAGPNAGYELAIANALWGAQGLPFQSDFTNLVGKNYGGGL